MAKCQNKIMKLSNWNPKPICRKITPAPQPVDCGGGKCFTIECKLPNGWKFDISTPNMILISTSPNFNSDESNINGSFILIDKKIDPNTILTTSICFDPSKHKELYYSIINCNVWYIFSSYRTSFGINIKYFDLFSGKIKINPEKCIQNLNINTCLEFCPTFNITFNFEENVKNAGLFYFIIIDEKRSCDCGNIRLDFDMLVIDYDIRVFPLILNNVIKDGILLYYETETDELIYQFPTLGCNETFDIPSDIISSQSKSIPKNSKIFELFSSKSQID
jgi:hypothetical protein